MWLFAYGSLIFRPGFPFQRRVRGYVAGFERRFWQHSTDHRGTPEQPGRVATLIAQPEARCWGVAYELSDADFDRYVASLDVREKNGYERTLLPFFTHDKALPPSELQAVTYIAAPGNPHFAGEAPLEEVAAVIRNAVGPSGHNAEYVLSLAEALLDLQVEDIHVFELANCVSDPDALIE